MTLGGQRNEARSGRTYNRLLEDCDDDRLGSVGNSSDNSNGHDTELTNEATPLSSSAISSSSAGTVGLESTDGEITLVVLDVKQQRFRVMASPDWTVAHFKQQSFLVHKVPPQSQRLIFMGKLLKDSETLRECKLTESDQVIHLFPKPKFVLKTNSPQNAGSNNNLPSGTTSQQDHSNFGSNGRDEESDGHIESNELFAHVPQIVLDDTSLSAIIINNELFEAQQRVKLLSFILLVISSMELLTLVTVFLGSKRPSEDSSDYPPGDPTDYVSSLSSGYDSRDSEQLRTWQTSDYADVVVSGLGVYVSILGLKASTDNTPQLALEYFVGLVIVGCSWLGYYFYLSVTEENKRRQGCDNNDGDDNNNSCGGADINPAGNIYADAFVGLLIPLMVWLTCFFRAWRFRVMLIEAQQDTLARQEEQHGRLREEASETAEDNESSGAVMV